MKSRDRFWALVFVWSVYGLVVGITCTVGGTQIEEIALAAMLTGIVLVATAQLSGYTLQRGWVAEAEKPKRERLIETFSEDDLALLRERLAAQDVNSTYSPPLDR